MDSSKIRNIIAVILFLLTAFYFGISAVTAQLETILWMVGGMILLACILIGRRIWLLIPLMSAVNLGLRIPGQPNTLLLAQFLVIGFCIIFFLMRRLPYRLEFTELEFWILVLSILIAQVYIRNPVSVSLFGGSTVGGKGYFLYAIALVSALLLSGLRVPAKDLKLILPLSIFGGLTNLSVSILGTFIPSIGMLTGTSISQTQNEGYNPLAIDTGAATRIVPLGLLSSNLALWISSYISPLRACLRPLWAILVILALTSAAMSGFRNSIATVGLTLLLGIAYRSGIVGVTFSLIGSMCGLALLAMFNLISPLAPNIQRSLTFLPGTWEQRYKDDAKGSTEWRTEIWKEALTSKRWIQNKWLGDGLGFTATELSAQMNTALGKHSGLSGMDAHRDIILSNGDYHSGPVSTIRVIGYIGLLFFLLAQIRLAVHAHRQIRRCRKTEWYPLALFMGIPMIYGPLFFVLIFGDFKTGASTFLLSLGMMRLLENNLPLPAYVKRNRLPFLLPAVKHTHRSKQQLVSGSHVE